MEVADKIKICSTCKNREFNPECGTVCSFTKEKPSFDDKCDKYVADEAQLSKEASKAEALEEEKSISGWLAFFFMGRCWLGCTYLCDNGSCSNFWPGIWMVFHIYLFDNDGFFVGDRYIDYYSVL